MCPHDCFTHRRWNFPFFFCPCRIAANSLCHSRRFCQSVVFGCLLLFQFSGLIKIDCKQHIQSLTRVSDSLVEGAIKEWSPASDTMGLDGSSKDNWCYAWGSWRFPGEVWIWAGLGSSWCLDSLEAQACRPCKTGQFFTTWNILGRVRVPLKNQALPLDTGKGVLK